MPRAERPADSGIDFLRPGGAPVLRRLSWRIAAPDPTTL
jgi:hypothetical protein